MATISCQPTRTSGAVSAYATKGPVAVSALNASVPLFEQRLRQIRIQHGKDGYQARQAVDENGNAAIVKDSKGNTVYEAKYVQAYALVQSFAPDELDPNDPASWERAQELGRALADAQFNGHPALIATEVNGRSGCVHNHIIVGAVHPETGKSIDSNLVTHSRLALAHDRVLAEHGHQQRDDMVRVAEAAAQQIEEAKAAVQAEIDGMPEGQRPSESQQKRMLLAAEKNVKFQGTNELTAAEQRDAKRMREYGQYMLNEQTRTAAREIGIEPEPERFSEIVLEERIRATLADPRIQSWEDLTEVSREYGLTVKQSARGNDVSYGMMLEQPDGTLREPARAHTRRGGNKDKGNGLGEGFRVEDVQHVIDTNIQLTQSDAFFDDQRNAQALEDLEEQRQADLAEAEANQRRIEFAVANPQMLASMERYKLSLQQDVSTQLDARGEMVEMHGGKQASQLMASAGLMSPEDLDTAKTQAEELYGEHWREMTPEDVQALRFQKIMDEGMADSSARLERLQQDAESRHALIDTIGEEQRSKDQEPADAQETSKELDQAAEAGTPVRQPQRQPSTVQQASEPAPATERQPWRSRLRGVEAKSGAEKVQARIDGLADLEEAYKDRGMVPDAEFEQKVQALGGVNRQFLQHYSGYLDPQMHEQLEMRAAKTEMARAHFDKVQELRKAYSERRDELKASREAALDGDSVLRDLRQQGAENKAGYTALRDEVHNGDYADYGSKHRAQQRRGLRDQKMSAVKTKVEAGAQGVVPTPQEKAFAKAQGQTKKSRSHEGPSR